MLFSSSRAAAIVSTSLLSLSLLGLGCGPSLPPGVNIDNDTLNIQGNGGGLSAGENVQIPSNFPADFPRYPGAKITVAYMENEGRASTLMQETSDSLDQAHTNLKQALTSQGYSEDNVMTATNVMILSYSKDNIKYQANITRQNDKTMIQLVRVERAVTE